MDGLLEIFDPPALARAAINCHLEGRKMTFPPAELHRSYRSRAGVFVSLKKAGQLRGCIGTWQGVRDNIAEEIAANAIAAGFRDPRFPALRGEELPQLRISVDILGPLEQVEDRSLLDPARYGVYARAESGSGLLLPALEGISSVDEQLDIVRRKAGIGPDEEMEIYRFVVTRYSEHPDNG